MSPSTQSESIYEISLKQYKAKCQSGNAFGHYSQSLFLLLHDVEVPFADSRSTALSVCVFDDEGGLPSGESAFAVVGEGVDGLASAMC